VEALGDHPSALAAIAASGVTEAQRPAYVKALADLARSHMIEPREAA
jgi:putative mycofactocin binding protein MftB